MSNFATIWILLPRETELILQKLTSNFVILMGLR
ncbi:hypothetical protein M8C21_008072 [Ambrosia artemisiifolia]|uniref:Uncharacterized protein n=1 Tax=Ambrosia artemisiifolia TaxID=4212 RepID=A0AAD5G3A8_AMBAR|nr:hypothetical protein M8C21_008072 [Ambrosia artemisiifolia]